MIPELGHFALIIAFALSCLLGTVPLWGAWRQHAGAMNMAPTLALGVFVFFTAVLWFSVPVISCR